MVLCPFWWPAASDGVEVMPGLSELGWSGVDSLEGPLGLASVDGFSMSGLLWMTSESVFCMLSLSGKGSGLEFFF